MTYFNDNLVIFVGGYLITKINLEKYKNKIKNLNNEKNKKIDQNSKFTIVKLKSYKDNNDIFYINDSNIINNLNFKTKYLNYKNYLLKECSLKNYLNKTTQEKEINKYNFIPTKLSNKIISQNCNFEGFLKYLYRKKKIKDIQLEYKSLMNNIFSTIEVDINLFNKKLLDTTDMIIRYHNFEFIIKLLLNKCLNTTFEELSNKFKDKLINKAINIEFDNFNDITFSIYKNNIISTEIYKLWSKGKNINNIDSLIHFLNKENFNDELLNNFLKLRLFHGYIIYNKLKKKTFNLNDFKILIKYLNDFIDLDKKNNKKYAFIIGIIILTLKEEIIVHKEIYDEILKLVQLPMELNSNYFLKNLIITHLIDINKKYSLIKEEIFYKLLNKFRKIIYLYFNDEYFIQNKLNKKNRIIIKKIQVDIIDYIIKKDLIDIQTAKKILELKFKEVQNDICLTLNNESNIELDISNSEILTKIFNYFENKSFKPIFLNYFIKSLKFILENIESEKKECGFFQNYINSQLSKEFNINDGKLKFNNQINFYKLYCKLNNKINEYYLCSTDNKDNNFDIKNKIFKLIFYYNIPIFVQKNIEENISKNNSNWSLINEGLKLLNNCLLINFENKQIFEIDKMIEFTNKLLNNFKISFNNLFNKKELKSNIPQSNVYFELLRLLHNLEYFKNNYKTEIGFLYQGIIPLNFPNINLINSYNHTDFLNNYINNYFKKNIGINFELIENKKNENDVINIIFIHGFLGSAFKSWNLDITKNSKIPTIIENNFDFKETNNQLFNENNSELELELNKLDNQKIISILEEKNYLMWPKILLGNSCKLRLFAVDYSHQIFNNSMTLNEISKEIYEKLFKANIFDYNSILKQKNNIIICHSMGGILLKMIISNHPEITKNIKGIIFFGTPHFGTNFHSNFINLFKKKIPPYIVELSTSLNIKQLKKLNINFQKILYSIPKKERPIIYSFSEYLPSKIPFLFNISKIIVPHFNSNPFIGNFYVLNTNHNNINKLTLYKNDIRYLFIKHLINL